jgi:hypothetical protein
MSVLSLAMDFTEIPSETPDKRSTWMVTAPWMSGVETASSFEEAYWKALAARSLPAVPAPPESSERLIEGADDEDIDSAAQ